MKPVLLFLITILLIGCASEKPRFKKERVCSEEALKYLRNPRNKEKRALNNPLLTEALSQTSRSMQLCYEDFKNRTGNDEFNTCLVVGVDESGSMEFKNFGSKDVELDDSFMKCARAVTDSVPYSTYGSNYILIQSYQFYVGDL